MMENYKQKSVLLSSMTNQSLVFFFFPRTLEKEHFYYNMSYDTEKN